MQVKLQFRVDLTGIFRTRRFDRGWPGSGINYAEEEFGSRADRHRAAAGWMPLRRQCPTNFGQLRITEEHSKFDMGQATSAVPVHLELELRSNFR
jgi:hypothetical protein